MAPRTAATLRDAALCLLLAPIGFALGARALAAPHGGLVPALVLAALVYPVVEELVFRRGLQSALMRHAAQAWPRQPRLTSALAIGATALAFGALHVVTRGPLTGALVLPPALLLGLLYDRHCSVTACATVHGAWNAAFVAGGAWVGSCAGAGA